MPVPSLGTGGPLPRVNPILASLPAYPTTRLKRWRQRVRDAGLELFDLGIGDPVEEVPRFIRDALVEGIPVLSGYPSAKVARAVAHAAAGYLERRFGVSLDPDREILITSGGKSSAYELPFLVCDPDDPPSILFPDPGYPAYMRGARLAGAHPVPVPLTGDFRMRAWELAPEVLDRAALLWVNTPHNPTGAVLGLDDLARTAELGRSHDVLVVSDESYADVYAADPPASILQVAREGVLAVHSLSKRSGLTGYRSGFVAGDPVWIARLRTLHADIGVQSQDFVNAAAIAAWGDDDHAEARRLDLTARKSRVRAVLEAMGLDVVASEGSYYLWVRAPRGTSGMALAEALLDRGVLVAPGAWYAVTDAGDDFVRVALCLDGQRLDRALALWRGVLEER